MNEPTTTVTLAPGNLAAQGWYRALSVTGVATEHELWIDESGGRAIYVYAPSSGPVTALTRWARTERELPAWTFTTRTDTYEEQVLAEDYVIAQARAEIRAELNS